MKTSTLVLFIATILLLILQSTSTQAREFDDFLERRAGGATNWENEDNVDKNRRIHTLLQRMSGKGSGLFSEEKRGSSKSIDMMMDKLNIILWCRQMELQSVMCK